jgi:hypothetical protein
MIEGEVDPRQCFAARLATVTACRIPNQSSLFRRKTTLRILSSEETPQESTQNTFTCLSLVVLVSRLQNSMQVISIQPLVGPDQFDLKINAN